MNKQPASFEDFVAWFIMANVIGAIIIVIVAFLFGPHEPHGGYDPCEYSSCGD